MVAVALLELSICQNSRVRARFGTLMSSVFSGYLKHLVMKLGRNVVMMRADVKVMHQVMNYGIKKFELKYYI